MFHKDYWKDNESECIEYLDSLTDGDLKAYLQPGLTIEEIMNLIEDVHGGLYRKKFNSNEYLFNALMPDEFESYLSTRFNIRFQEEVREVLLWCKPLDTK